MKRSIQKFIERTNAALNDSMSSRPHYFVGRDLSVRSMQRTDAAILQSIIRRASL